MPRTLLSSSAAVPYIAESRPMQPLGAPPALRQGIMPRLGDSAAPDIRRRLTPPSLTRIDQQKSRLGLAAGTARCGVVTKAGTTSGKKQPETGQPRANRVGHVI